MEEKLTETQLTLMGSGELAYLGDSVYEMNIRRGLILRGTRKADCLVQEARRYVSAARQAAIAEAITPHLTSEELGVMRRGRNHKTKSAPRHASAQDYGCATGLECLFGYLSLKEDCERIGQLIDLIFEKGNEQ